MSAFYSSIPFITTQEVTGRRPTSVLFAVFIGLFGFLSPARGQLPEPLPIVYDLDRSLENSRKILTSTQTLAALDPTDPYPNLLPLAHPSRLPRSQILLLHQAPWSVTQLTGSCYSHTAAEIISAAYYRATEITAGKGQSIVLDGELMSQWYWMTQVGDLWLWLKWKYNRWASVKDIFSGGFDDLSITSAIENDGIFIRNEKSRAAATEILAKGNPQSQSELYAFQKATSPEFKNADRLRFPDGQTPHLRLIWRNLQKRREILSIQAQRFDLQQAIKYFDPWRGQDAKLLPRIRALLYLLDHEIPVSVAILIPAVLVSTDGGESWQPKLTGDLQTLHAVTLIGYAVLDGKLNWVFRNHGAENGMSYIRFPFEESFRIVSAHALLLPGESDHIEKIDASKSSSTKSAPN